MSMGKRSKGFRVTVAVVGLTFTLLAAFASLVWAAANGSGRITQNERRIVAMKEQLGRIEMLTVAVAQKVGADVSGLFKPK